MINIAYLRLGRAFGGVESYLLNLISALPGFCSGRLLLRGERTITEAREKGFPVEVLKKERKLDIRLFYRLPRYLRNHPTDIIHSQGELSDFLAARARSVGAVPFHVITLHTFPETDFSLGRLKLAIYNLMNRYSWRRADRIIVVYRGRVTELEKRGVPREKIRVIYNGINPVPFQKPPDEAWRTRLGISPDNRLIGAVGRLVPEKGHLLLVKAFADLLIDYPDLRLLIVGDGPELKILRRETRQKKLKGKILYQGERDDIPEVLAALNLYILPSLTEAFPIGLLEAMAAGKPVIASRVGGVPEVISSGDNGLLTIPGRTEDLKIAIRRLLDDQAEAEKLGREARKTVQDRFTARKMAEATGQLYQELINP